MTADELVIDLALAGPSESEWSEVCARLAPVRWPAFDRLVVVGPHPDDETLGAGGLIATTVDQGKPVVVMTVTDGEAAFAHHDLASVRRSELAAALACLGDGRLVEHLSLGVPDGRVESHTGLVADALAHTLVRGDLVVCPLLDDGHPDHAATSAAATAAATAVGCPVRWFPVWAWHCHDAGSSVLQRGQRLDLSESVRQRKRRAVRCYVSQTDGPTPVVPQRMIERLTRPYEVFVDPEDLS